MATLTTMFSENIWSLLTSILWNSWFIPGGSPSGKSSRRSYAFLGLLGAHDLGPFPSRPQAQHAEPHWLKVSNTFIHTWLFIFYIHHPHIPLSTLPFKIAQNTQLSLTEFQLLKSVNSSITNHYPPSLTSRRRYLVHNSPQGGSMISVEEKKTQSHEWKSIYDDTNFTYVK